MNYFKKNKGKIFVLVLAIVALIISFFFGENNNKINEDVLLESVQKTNDFVEEVPEEKGEVILENEKNAVAEQVTENEEIFYEKSSISDNVSEEKQLICTISVNCAEAVGKCESKADVIPEDGVILSPADVEFNSGDTVFDVLKREMINNKIHLEFSITPIYNSAYIEGIGNLYEFDCGAESGWVYKVNGNAPNYSSSMYKVNPGDVIEWIYTCG